MVAGQFRWRWYVRAVDHFYYFQKLYTAFRSGLRVALQVARGRLGRGHRSLVIVGASMSYLSLLWGGALVPHCPVFNTGGAVGLRSWHWVAELCARGCWPYCQNMSISRMSNWASLPFPGVRFPQAISVVRFPSERTMMVYI